MNWIEILIWILYGAFLYTLGYTKAKRKYHEILKNELMEMDGYKKPKKENFIKKGIWW